MREQMNEHMAVVLNRRLCDEGKHLKSTVVPMEWTPIDAELNEGVEQEKQWNP